jgi:hypothetical protein
MSEKTELVSSGNTTEDVHSENQLAVQESNILKDIGITADDYKDIAAAMSENIGLGEIQISRISIAQAQSPEVMNQLAGFAPGVLFDSSSKEPISLFGKPPWLIQKGVDPAELKGMYYLPLVFVFKLPTEYVLWPTKEERQQGIKNFHWKCLDAMDPRVREGMWPPKGIWKPKEGGPKAPPVTEHINLLAIPLNEDATSKCGMMVASFSRTSFKTGKNIVTALQQHTLNPQPASKFWFSRVYYLYTELAKYQGGSCYVYRFAKGPSIFNFGATPDSDLEANKEIFRLCLDQSKQLSSRETGRQLQEMMINAAQFSDDEAMYGGDDTGESTETGGTENSDDPTF